RHAGLPARCGSFLQRNDAGVWLCEYPGLSFQRSPVCACSLVSSLLLSGATMSQQSSLTQSAHSVRQVLTAYTPSSRRRQRRPGGAAIGVDVGAIVRGRAIAAQIERAFGSAERRRTRTDVNAIIGGARKFVAEAVETACGDPGRGSKRRCGSARWKI